MFGAPLTDIEVLPTKNNRNILITSALPYVNNVPHLGNIIGCVLSADVYARFCRLRGYNTLYICGTDEYGTATETKALQEHITPKELCDKYHALHHNIYKWFNIEFDHFGRTSTEQQTKITQDIFQKCDENKYITENEIKQLYCKTCERFLSDRFVVGTCPRSECKYKDARGDQCDKCGHLLNSATVLVSPICTICSNTPFPKTSQHLFLDLPRLSKPLEEFVSCSSKKGQWTDNAIKITNAWLRDGLEPRCITRDLKWGTPVLKEKYQDKVFYCWFDAPIGYISITAGYTQKWQEWWKPCSDALVELYQFMGKDNILFHTTMFPATLLGTHEKNYTMLHHINACEFLNYETGKFSKSRNSGVFGDDAMKSTIPSEVWRYYLLSTRPETSDSTFSWEQFVNVNNGELLANLGNYVQRSLKFVKMAYNGIVPDVDNKTFNVKKDQAFLDSIQDLTQQYISKLEKVEIRDALKIVMKLSALGNKYFQDNAPWKLIKSNDKQKCNVIISQTLHLIRWIAILVAPYMPSVSGEIFKQLNCKIPIGALHDSNLVLETFMTNIFSTGHVIGEPIPIFREIYPKERDTLKEKFKGK